MVKKILVLASGRGTDFQSLVDHENLGILRGIKIEGVVCNHEGAMVFDRAKTNNIQSFYIQGVRGRKFAGPDEREAAREKFDEEWYSIAKRLRADIVVLAGFDQILSRKVVEESGPLMINIHPAYDLQRFGGVNMIGSKVHELVLKSGVKFSGCSVHLVTKDVDLGPPILKKKVRIPENETIESLESRVLALEHLAYPEALQLFADERVMINQERTMCFVDRLSNNWDVEWTSRQNKYLVTHQEESSILKDWLD